MRARTNLSNESVKNKEWLSFDDASFLFSLGRTTLERVAKESNARRKIGGRVLYNKNAIDEYIKNSKE